MMNANEEKMRSGFEAYCREAGLPWPGTESTFYRMWQAATARKQREYDGLMEDNQEFQREIDALNQQILGLSAQVERMHDELKRVKDVSLRECGVSFVDERVLSLEPSAALLAHDNEVAATALEEAANNPLTKHFIVRDYEGDECDSADELLRRMATERRNRK